MTRFATQSHRFNGRARRRSRSASPLKFQEMIVLAADLSPSMESQFRLAGHRTTTRLDALREAATLWLTQKAAASRLAQVCLIGFDRSVRLYRDWTPLSRLNQVAATIRTFSCIDGYTNIGGAVEA